MGRNELKEKDWIVATKKKWLKINDEYKKKFTATKDPNVIIDFFKKHRFAVREEWTVKEVQRWIEERDYDLLAKLQPQRGERKENYFNEEMNLIWVNRVDDLIKQGIQPKAAFIDVAKKYYIALQTLRNKYYKTKRKTPEVYIFENDDTLTIAVSPTKVELFIKDISKPVRIYGSVVLSRTKN